MNRRSRARQVALQLLFQQDANRTLKRSLIERFVRERLRDDPSAEPFCMALFEGVQRHRTEIDARLSRTASNWKLHRMAIVDRNVMRLSVYEMFYQPEPTPGPVALDEAIELSRRYGSVDSPAFVNGVLDRIYKQHLEAQARAANTAAAQAKAAAAPTPPQDAPDATPNSPPLPTAERVADGGVAEVGART